MISNIKRFFLIVISVVFVFIGCADLLVEPDTTKKPDDIFEFLWSEIDRYYPFFKDKNVDWDSVYIEYTPQIDNTMSEEDLFLVLSDMVNTLRDGHVNIYTPYGTSAYTGWYDQYPRNFDFNVVMNRYLGITRREVGGGNIIYGRLGSIGYIYLRTFAGEAGWVDSMDEVIEVLYDYDGVIVDVRHNGGGRSRNARSIAGRFADRERLYAYTQFRNGPQHTDFTELEGRKVVPDGDKQFLKPVVVLTNRSTYSASEDFVLAMKEFPHVTHIGDTTGGGLGNPIFRELPNGWGFRVPVWRQFPVDMKPIEGIGISPDIQVDITREDSLRLRDTIIQEAFNYLNSRE